MSYNFDPELQPLIDLLPESDFSDPVSARENLESMISAMSNDLDDSGLLIDDHTIEHQGHSVGVRLYRPENLEKQTAALLYIHGGGFAVGSLDSEHVIVTGLCKALGVVIVSVDYRLAPEHPYPAALEDCYQSLCWLHDNAEQLQVDHERIAVMGSSAGGGLSAALALLAKDRKGPSLCFQFLGIPELDDRLTTTSMRQFTDTPLWSRPNAVLSWQYYLGNQYKAGGDDVPYHAAPARAEDVSGLPPAYISTMEYDPLRDEGIEYALKLLRAGVNVELHSYPGTFHGSSMVPTAAVSQRAMQETLVVLRRALGL